MTDDQGSPPLAGVHRTAVGAATLRAFHLFREGEPKILRDEFALPLSGLSEEELVGLVGYPHTSAAWVSMPNFSKRASRCVCVCITPA